MNQCELDFRSGSLYFCVLFKPEFNYLRIMNKKEITDMRYEAPSISLIELYSEGVLCSSDNANEMLEENEGIW